MKTLLIIEMPDNYTLDNYYAEVVVKRKKNNNKIKAFPHVSLKPLPKRIGSASEYGSDEVYIKHLINWKKEVDEILGEQK